MWYVVDILFAQKPESDTETVLCESCHVLFNCESALKACARAKEWAKDYEVSEGNSGFYYVGISHLWGLLSNDQPKDGDEIGGDIFEKENVWGRVSELIPDPNEIPTVRFEENSATPIKHLINNEKVDLLKKIAKK